MAGEFQRRNVGALADLPDLANIGMSAYTDFGESPIGAETANMAVGEGLIPTGAGGGAQAAPVSVEEMAARGGISTEDAARMMIAQAEKARDRAGQPINRGLSAVGGIIGAPLKFLGAALGGGDMTRITEPFRPKQTADDQFQQTMLRINSQVDAAKQERAKTGASVAAAVAMATKNEREAADAGYADVGRWAAGLLYVNPQERQAVASKGLPVLLQRYPDLAPMLETFSDLSDTSLARMASLTKDESANKMLQEYIYGNKVINAAPNSVSVVLPSRPGADPQTIWQEGPAPQANPYLSSYGGVPAPEVGDNGNPKALTFEQYTQTAVKMGGEATADYVLRNQIPVQVKTPDEAKTLPSGAVFIDPTGNLRKVP